MTYSVKQGVMNVNVVLFSKHTMPCMGKTGGMMLITEISEEHRMS